MNECCFTHDVSVRSYEWMRVQILLSLQILLYFGQNMQNIGTLVKSGSQETLFGFVYLSFFKILFLKIIMNLQ